MRRLLWALAGATAGLLTWTVVIVLTDRVCGAPFVDALWCSSPPVPAADRFAMWDVLLLAVWIGVLTGAGWRYGEDRRRRHLLQRHRENLR